jgi:hypothetical protein
MAPIPISIFPSFMSPGERERKRERKKEGEIQTNSLDGKIISSQIVLHLKSFLALKPNTAYCTSPQSLPLTSTKCCCCDLDFIESLQRPLSKLPEQPSVSRCVRVSFVRCGINGRETGSWAREHQNIEQHSFKIDCSRK